MNYLIVGAFAVVVIMISGVIGKIMDRMDQKYECDPEEHAPEEHAPDEYLWSAYVKHDPKD